MFPLIWEWATAPESPELLEALLWISVQIHALLCFLSSGLSSGVSSRGLSETCGHRVGRERGEVSALSQEWEEIRGSQSLLINPSLPRTNIPAAAGASDTKKPTVNATYLCASCQLARGQPISFKKRDIYFHPFRGSQFISDHHQLKKLYKLAAFFFLFFFFCPFSCLICF